MPYVYIMSMLIRTHTHDVHVIKSPTRRLLSGVPLGFLCSEVLYIIVMKGDNLLFMFKLQAEEVEFVG